MMFHERLQIRMSGLAMRNKAIFCLSWLSNASVGFINQASTQKQANHDQQVFAKQQIQQRLQDKRLSQILGEFKQLVWGPAVFICETKNTIPKNRAAEKEYLANNLVFVVKAQLNDLYTYVIAVAETHSASKGTLQTDSSLSESLPWPKPNSGSISLRTAKGLSQLLTMREDTGIFLEDFLKTELFNLPNGAKVEIAVTGHLWGGALSTVLALRIKEDLSQWNPSIHLTVSAWPNASPSPGDQSFADYMISTLAAENYQSMDSQHENAFPTEVEWGEGNPFYFDDQEKKALMEWGILRRKK